MRRIRGKSTRRGLVVASLVAVVAALGAGLAAERST